MAVGEWDQRQLCPDGGCVGVIGPDGTCKVCGHAAPNWGDERKRGLIDPPEGPDEDEDDDDETEGDDLAANEADYDREDDEEDDHHEDGVAASPSPSEWSARRLCPDGACIGLIGPDGKCRVCGRAASGAEPTAAAEPGEVIAGAPASADSPDPAGELPPGEPVAAEPVTAEPVPAEPVPSAQVTAEPVPAEQVPSAQATSEQDKVAP